MIRPFTFICMVGALGSGLYLYQCKHEAQVLDRKIASAIKETDQTRERIGLLRAEWTQLNQPDRVSDLAHAHTALQTAKPTQFVSLTDLAAKLPPPVAPTPVAPIATQPADLESEEPLPPVAVAPEPRPAAVARRPDPKPDPVPDPKPTRQASRPSSAATPAATPAAATSAATTPAVAPPPQVAVTTAAVRTTALPIHSTPAPRRTAIASNDATAPGTVGASVLRAHAAHEAQAYVQPVAAPSAAPPSYSPPAYAAPAYTAPSYAPPPTYAASSGGSVLGGARGLPPPVPFAAR